MTEPVALSLNVFQLLFTTQQHIKIAFCYLLVGDNNVITQKSIVCKLYPGVYLVRS